MSESSKRIWIASPYLGRDAHNVFHPSFQSATDTRLLIDVRSGAVDRIELERLRHWAPNRVRTLRRLHAKMYIFDRGAIVTSANLSLPAFEHNHEIGLLYTGVNAKKMRQAFSTWYSNASTVNRADVTQLPKRKINVGGAKGAAVKKHTTVDFWDLGANEGQSGSLSQDEESDAVAPTADIAEWLSEKLDKRVENELARRGLKRVQTFTSEYGVRRARKQYPIGAVFDASCEVGSKSKTWRLGAERHIGIVRAVFLVSNNAVVVYRIVKRYYVTKATLDDAKRLHVFSGRPDSFEMIAYRKCIQYRTVR